MNFSNLIKSHIYFLQPYYKREDWSIGSYKGERKIIEGRGPNKVISKPYHFFELIVASYCSEWVNGKPAMTNYILPDKFECHHAITREVNIMDLPLYLGSKYVFPEMERLLKDGD